MNATCPNCDLELNEHMQCARCGYLSADSFSADDDGQPADVASSPSDPLDLDDSADLEAAVVGAEDELAEYADEDDPLREGEETSPPDMEPVGEDSIGETDENETDEDAEDGPGAVPRPPASATDSISVDRSKFRDLFQVEHLIFNPPGQKDDDERSLVDFTEPLPPKGPRQSEFASEDLDDYLDKLKEERLILVSCPDEDIAFSAARALIHRLDLPQGGQRLLLNLAKSVGEGSLPSVYYLRGKGASYKETVVLVDAATEKARQFLEPILYAAPAAAASIQDNLRQNKMYMLCLVDPGQVEDAPETENGGARRTRELKFPCWRIPFLRRLLERHRVEAPEQIEREIDLQRKRGWWGRTEGDLYFELKILLLRGGLAKEIERRRDGDPPSTADNMFKRDELLPNVVLYVATFFPNLTPYEFNQLVPRLVSRASRADENGADGGSKAGARPRDATQEGQAALQVWRDAPDSILRDHGLVTIPVRGSTKGVNFSNHSIRDNLRGQLEREYNFFLENRFKDVQELGLVFNPSAKISQGAVRLSVEMAASYPEYYGSRWLVGMVAGFESSGAGAAGAAAWPFIEEANPAKARKRFYQKLSELVRSMLEDARLSEVVEDFLQQLLLLKHHGAVLEVVRRLQFAPSFDQFKWLKQLFDRGDQNTRAQAVVYLRGYLRRVGGRVHQLLNSLESWLPERERPLQRYPRPAWHALNMLLFYFSETTLKVNPRHYGSWPSACPLFDFVDAAATANDLGILVRLLFHPGMRGVFREQRNNEVKGIIPVNTMLTRWFFILQGRGEGDAHGHDNGAGAVGPQFDGAAVGDLLLEQVVHNLSRPQQADLLMHWSNVSQEMLGDMNTKPRSGPEWRELAWRRDLVVELMSKYERLRGAAAVSR